MGRRKKFENRFDIIVEAASRIFAEQGYENTTMDEIAKACSLGKATLYAEFESKEELMNTVIEHYMRDAVTLMKAKADQATDDYLAIIRAIMLERIMGIFTRATRHFHSVEIMMAARLGNKDKLRFEELKAEETRIIAILLEKAALNHEIAPLENYYKMAQLFRKALAGLFPPNIFNISPEEFERDAHNIIDIYLSGLTVFSRSFLPR